MATKKKQQPKKKKKKGAAKGAKKAKPTRSKKAGAKKAVAKAKARAKKPAVKAKARKPVARKPAARRAAPAAKAPVTVSESMILDEVLEEPLLDASTILRVKDRVARSQGDVDEDALRQFPDPSLVVDVDTQPPQREGDEDSDVSGAHLPELFASEARRQKAQRAAEPRPTDSTSKRHDGSLFGALHSDGDDDDDDSDED